MIQEAFMEFGHIMRIDILEAQGIVLVEFEDKGDAKEASEVMDGKKICNQSCIVKMAESRDFQVTPAASSAPFGAKDSGPIIRQGSIKEQITMLAKAHNLDEAASERLQRAFADRERLGCDLQKDVQDFGEHLGASNKPSALVSMKLAELRAGKPIGECKYGMRR